MADYGPWQELAIPGASLLARCAGRGRVLVDPISVLAIDLLMRAVEDRLKDTVCEWSSDQLHAVLGRLLELGVAVSEELATRTQP